MRSNTPSAVSVNVNSTRVVGSAEEIAKAAVTLTDRLGFPRSVLRDRIGITPACGLAGATPAWARTAVELAQKAADVFAQDPDAI